MKGPVMAMKGLLCAGILAASPALRAAGFPNEPQTPGALLSGVNGERQGRTALVAYHNGILYTVPESAGSAPGSDMLLRSWDLNAGRGPGGWFPQELGTHFTTSDPGMAHAFFQKGDFLYLGESTPQPWTSGRQVFRATGQFGVNVIETMSNASTAVNPAFLPGFDRRTQHNFRETFGTPIRMPGSMFFPWFVGANYTAYTFTPRPSYIYAPNGLARSGEPGFAEWDHIAWTNPGVVGRPYLLGNLLYFFSDQARTGASVAAYDITGLWQNNADPALAYKPRLLSVLPDPQRRIGGYFPEPFGLDGRLYAVFADNMPPAGGGPGVPTLMVADVTDPLNMRHVRTMEIPGPTVQYIQFQDEFAFTGGYKINMRNFISGTGDPVAVVFNILNQVRTDPAGPARLTSLPNIDVSQFALPLGNLVVTGGLYRNSGQTTTQGMAIWAHQADPDTRPPYVAYHNPAPNQTHYSTRAPLGFLLHETLNTSTIRVGDTFIVRPVGGQAVDGDWVYLYNDILSFTPGVKTTNADGTIAWTYTPLEPNTTYEVIFNGIEDAAGNAMPEYRFLFSTGNALESPPILTSFTAAPAPSAPGQTVTLTAVASSGNPIEYQFDFGDGSPRTAWGPANAQTHAYAAAGRYTATAWARSSSSAAVSRLAQVTVVNPLPAARPRHSGSLALGSNRLIWAVNPDNDSVAAVNADTLARVLETAVGRDPRNVAIDPQGRAWVTCFDSDEVYVLNGTDGSRIRVIPTGRGSRPFGVVFHPTRAEAYVSLHGSGRLAAFDSATFAPLGSVALGPTPRALALNGDGSRLYVTRFVSPGDRGEVWELNTSPLALSSTLLLPRITDPDTTNSGGGVPNHLSSVVLTPDGAQAWITSTKANTANAAPDDDNTVRNMVTLLDLAGRRVAGSVDVDNSDSASAAALSPLADYLLVANQGTNEVMAFESSLFNGAPGSFVGRFPAGLAPQGILVDPATGRTFVQNFMSRTLTVLETAGLFDAGNASVTQSQVSTSSGESLSAPVLRGKRIFYNAGDRRMSAEGYMTCATCHVDGADDGRVWNFTNRGEGLRRTIPLNGRGGTAQGRVHWTGNFDEIQDFEHDIRGAFGGTGFMSDGAFNAGTRNQPLGNPKAGHSADLDALAAYVSSLRQTPLSPFRAADGTLTTAAQAGRLVFQRQNCAVCHTGDSFTDSRSGLLHDVGTLRASSGQRMGGVLRGLDTPTLKGLWEASSYLHDGSAATLAGVLTAPNNARHGRMDQITPQERNDLVAYLRQIEDGETQSTALAPALVLGVPSPQGGDRYAVTVSAGLPMSRVDLFVDGQSAGSARLRPDGAYAAVVTLPAGWISLEAHGARQDGGLTLASTLNRPGLALNPPEVKEAYAYPNPAKGVDPVLRAFLGEVDLAEVTLFDQSGRAVHSARVTRSVFVDGRKAFEYRWTGVKAAGVYYAVIHGKKGGETVRARAKFAVIP